MHRTHPRRRRWLAILLPACACCAVSAQQAVPTRDQIAEPYKWNLSTLYADTPAWNADFAHAETLLDRLEQRQRVPLDSPTAVLDTLTLREDARWLTDKLALYANLLADQDMRNDQALALRSRAGGLQTSCEQAAAWIEPKLLALPEGRLRTWLKDDPQLAEYAHYIDDLLRRKPHTLSPGEEELLARAGNLASSPEETYHIFVNGELIWPTIHDEQRNELTLSPARFSKLIRSPDRRVRRETFIKTMAVYQRFENTLASTLNGAVLRNNFYAQARDHESALDAALFPDNLPPGTYTNLVETVNTNLPLLHRWAGLRKRVLGLNELHAYDLYHPLVTSKNREIEFDDAVALVVAALEPLGPEYDAALQTGFASRWIDVYETQGKRSGAYSWGSYDTPTFILLNYNKTLREATTLAHEMGHALHDHFTHRHQPKVYGEYADFVAEVPAAVNEILLENHLLQNAETRAERLRLLNHAIDNLRGMVFRQTLFAEFEAEIHARVARGEPLTADGLGTLYVDMFHKYWGPEVVRDAEHASYWAHVPHFYYDFYVYRYATSYCAAAALTDNLLAKKPAALEAYLTLLKAGSSDYPLELLRKAGVDMTTPDYIEATMRRFERLIDEFEKLLAEDANADGG